VEKISRSIVVTDMAWCSSAGLSMPDAVMWKFVRM
jgi:hypothetical protein